MNAPFKRGQWVADKDDAQRPIFGKVLDCYVDFTEPKVWLIDLMVYSTTGERIGRRSPREGGPFYEPALSASRFCLIKEPDFPLKTDYTCVYGHLLKALS